MVRWTVDAAVSMVDLAGGTDTSAAVRQVLRASEAHRQGPGMKRVMR
jgi:hypothetical protein